MPSLSFAADTDSQIESAAKASYNYRTVLQDHVQIKAHNGVVTLTGTVADSDQKALAENTVRNIPGVLSVDNQIKIGNADQGSDDWIALKLRSKLLLKGNVSSANTHVEVKDGVVTLTGTADNTAQKELTEVYAKEITGVKSVRNQLQVMDISAKNTSASDSRESTRQSRTTGEVIDDSAITSKVKYALLSHHSTSALKTDVQTREGVVTISGEAASDAEKTLVTKLAEDVPGVKSVTNNMTIRGQR